MTKCINGSSARGSIRHARRPLEQSDIPLRALQSVRVDTLSSQEPQTAVCDFFCILRQTVARGIPCTCFSAFACCS